MPGFLRRPAFWIFIVVLALAGGGVFYMQGQAADKKKKLEAAAKMEEPSPYAAIANGKLTGQIGYSIRVLPRHPALGERFVPGLLRWA